MSDKSNVATEYICEDCGRSAMDFEDVDHIFGKHNVSGPYRFRTRTFVAVDALLSDEAIYEAVKAIEDPLAGAAIKAAVNAVTGKDAHA